MRTRKRFVVTEIVTQPDGRVTLNGPKGSIDIYRHDNGSNAQYWGSQFIQTIEQDREHDCHRIKVAQIPCPHGSVIGGGTSF